MVGGIHRGERGTVRSAHHAQINEPLQSPSETSMYFKLHPPACYAVSLQQQQLRETTLGDENGAVEVEFCGSRRFFEEY